MARIRFSQGAFLSLSRIVEFTKKTNAADTGIIVATIEDGIRILGRHPLMGRLCEEGLRELVISRGRSGFVALYEYRDEVDETWILAIRHQREAGYTEG